MDREYAEYLLNRTKENYNLIAGEYSRTRGVVWEELKFLEDYVMASEKILDLGCGNGRLWELFQERAVDYYGVDVSERLIEIAKSRYPEAKFQVADALNLPFPDNFFDKIFSIAVLHHIPSKELRLQFLKEAKRVLKPNGLLILTVWDLWQRKTAWESLIKNIFLKLFGISKLDFKDIFYPWKSQNGKILIDRYFHLFTKRELKSLVQKLDFKVREIRIIERPPNKRSNILLAAEK